MRVSSLLPTMGSLVALAQARPSLLGLGGLTSLTKQSNAPTPCDLSKSWEDYILFEGICAAETETSAAVSLGLHLQEAQIVGGIDFDLVKNFLEEPKIRLGLGGLQAFVKLDVSASAAVHESVELFASSKLELELPALEAELGAAVALDLIVSVGAAIDLTAGVYISFGEAAFVEISLLTKDVVDFSVDGLVTKALPLGIGADVDLSAEIPIELGLRLRTEVGLGAELEIPVLDIEAGAEVAIWVSLFDYTATIVATDDCLVSVTEVVALCLGVAVELDVEVGDILDLSLAPTVSVTLALGAKASICMDNRGETGVFLGGPKPTPSGSVGGPEPSLSGLPSTGALEAPTSSLGPVRSFSGVPSGLPSGVPYGLPSVSTIGSLPSASIPTLPNTGDDVDVSTAVPTASLVPSDVGYGDSPTASGSNTDGLGISSLPYGLTTGSLPLTTGSPNGQGSGSDIITQTPDESGMVTRTATRTATYTITSCAASVVNCPARYTQKVVTSTVVKSVYVCPATATETPLPTSSVETKKPVSITTITETLTTIKPCKPTTNYFTPPSSPPPAPTVTIVDTTTVCPVKSGETATSTPEPIGTPSSFQATATPTTLKVVSSTPQPAFSSSSPLSSQVPPTTLHVPTTVPVIPVESAPFPPSNGTVSTSVPVVPVVPESTGVFTPPPALTTPAPSSPAVPEQPVQAGAGIVRAGVLVAALPMAMGLLF